MGYFNTGELKVVAKKVLLGQAISFLNSVTGVSTTKLVNNDASYPLLQSITSYLFIFLVYGPLFIFFLHRYRGKSFSNFAFLQNWWKYAILGFVDLEANYLVVLAYQYTNMMSIQLLDCFTIPCVLVLSLVILKMRFGPAHVLGCIVALGGMGLLIYLDAGGLSYTGDKGKEVLGDILCLLSSCCYALSNVLTEWFIKPKELAPLADRGAEQLGMDTQTQQGVPTAENVPSEKFVTLDDEPAQNAENQDQGGDDAQEVPPVPIYLPVIENLAMMSAFALCFATAQFFILEWKTFAPRRKKWTSEDWLFQMVFGITMLCLYTGMPTLFLITSAAFANISLLTADIYSILWNVTIFSIYPSAYFLFAYIIIVCGILLYNLPDVAKSSWMSNWNFLSGCRGGNPEEEDARGVLNKPERTEMASDPHNSKIETPR